MYYKAKELDPGKTIRGKVIEAWKVSDTRNTYISFGHRISRIMIYFVDGSREQGVLEEPLPR